VLVFSKIKSNFSLRFLPIFEIILDKTKNARIGIVHFHPPTLKIITASKKVPTEPLKDKNFNLYDTTAIKTARLKANKD